MRYLLGIIMVLILLGCGDNTNNSQSSISNTDALQPNIEHKEMQPPKPPAL